MVFSCEMFTLSLLAIVLGRSSAADSACVDLIHNCRSYGQDVCVSYQDWAKTRCAYTCKFCTGTPPPSGCKDYVTNCDSYADDLCTNLSYSTWAKDNCPKFCGFCSQSTAATAAQTAVQTTKTPVQSTGLCTDTVNFCLVYSKKACDDTAWADAYCRKWCSRC